MTAHKDFMLALLEAVSKDQTSLSQMQITDAQSTMIATQIEEAIYQFFNGPNGPLAKDQTQIAYWAGDEIIDGKHVLPPNGPDANEVIIWQKQYSTDSARAQGAESQQDGAVQSGQGQTSADATNLQMKAQMVQTMNGLQTALSNMLGMVTA